MIDLDRIQSALNSIPADDRDTWLHMGMAIRSELDNSGFNIWDTWSQKSDSYNAKSAQAVWKSIDTKGGVTVGTLFHEARKNGWHGDTKVQTQSSNKLSTSERQRLRDQIVSARKQRIYQLLKTHTKASARANSIWEKSRPVINHPYLRNKQVKPHGIRQNGSNLVIPLRDTTGALKSLQFINPKEGKRLLAGGKKAGHFHLIGDPCGVLLICEGYSTAATLYEATGYATVMAVDAGNLKPVGEVLREKHPSIRLIFCADNDAYGPVNTGINKATEAARTVQGFVAAPVFQDITSKPTDFNDLHRLEGTDAIGRVT